MFSLENLIVDGNQIKLGNTLVGSVSNEDNTKLRIDEGQTEDFVTSKEFSSSEFLSNNVHTPSNSENDSTKITDITADNGSENGP